MKVFLLAALSLLLSACGGDKESGDSRRATFIRTGGGGGGDIEERLFHLETLRMQRDMLENDRLRLWLDHRGDVTVVSRPRSRR